MESFRTETARSVYDFVGSTTEPFTLRELRSRLGLTTRPDTARVVVREMMSRGEVERISTRAYRFLGYKPLVMRRKVGALRLYRAMWMKGAFVARDLMHLADAEKSSVQKLIKVLLEAGVIELACMARNHNNQPERVYRILHRDTFFMRFVFQKN